MAIMTRWDAFQDLRGAQDQMNEIYKLVAQVRGQPAMSSSTSSSVAASCWWTAAGSSPITKCGV